MRHLDTTFTKTFLLTYKSFTDAAHSKLGYHTTGLMMLRHPPLQQKGESRTKTAISLEPPPMPIIPKTSKKLKLLEFDALEVARQLTMIECHLYMKIRPSECLMRSREQKSDNNDNIAAIIVTTNKV